MSSRTRDVAESPAPLTGGPGPGRVLQAPRRRPGRWRRATAGTPWSRPESPALAQAVFAGLVVLDLTTHAVWVGPLPLPPQWGLVLLALVTAATVVLPWPRLGAVRHRVIAAVAVADVAVVGLAWMDPAGNGAGVLLVLPAFVLGRVLGLRGIAVVGAAAVLLVAVPSLVYLHGIEAVVPRTVTAVAAAVTVAGASAVSVGRLRRQLEVEASVADSLGVGLMVVGRQPGGAVLANAFQRELLALSRRDHTTGVDDLSGGPHVFGPDGVTRLPARMWPQERVARGEEFDDQRIWVGPDPATRRAFSVSARGVRDSSGRVEVTALTSHEVTDLERALQVKQDFVASVSHELRTPLTSINGYALLLLDRDDLPDQVRSQLGVISRNADRLSRLVADLLMTSEQSVGTALSRSDHDLAQLATDAARTLGPAARAAHVEITVVVDPVPVVASLDPHRVAQVLDNLLTNAVKFTPVGGQVRVSVTRAGPWALLDVEDSGDGIEEQELQQVFQRFYRSPHVRDGAVPGVGLGLSIVHGVVSAHGGEVAAARSELGGARLHVRLPIEA